MNRKRWSNIKKSGAFKRKLKKNYIELLRCNSITPDISTRQVNINHAGVGSAQNLILRNFDDLSTVQSESKQYDVSESTEIRSDDLTKDSEEGEDEVDEIFDKLCLSDSSDYESESEASKNYILRDSLNKWAIRFNIAQEALRDLNKILNKRIPCSVPKDPRTLLNNKKKNISIIPVDSGHYWHNGLITMLKSIFLHLDSEAKCISLNINIDGLPLFKSSKHQVWPILCNIHEYPNIPPLVVGVYEGTSKPIDLSSFLQPFIDELLELYRNDLKFTTRQRTEATTTVKVRAVICDSPARALIKGDVSKSYFS